MASELRVQDFALEETDNKLSVLWIWGFASETRQPICTVLAAEEVRKTAQMMPHCVPDTSD